MKLLGPTWDNVRPDVLTAVRKLLKGQLRSHCAKHILLPTCELKALDQMVYLCMR